MPIYAYKFSSNMKDLCVQKVQTGIGDRMHGVNVQTGIADRMHRVGRWAKG
jgi:hypothetical protein